MNNTFSFQQIAAPKVLSAEVREAISNNVLQFYVRDQQQDTQDEGITALYERLSQEDKLEGESNSIANQKKILERYCRSMGLLPICTMTPTTAIPARTLLGLDSDTFYIYHVAAVMVDNLRRLLLGINLSDKAIMDFDFPGVGFPV